MSTKHLDDIVINNMCRLNEQHDVSLRQLSTDIGCSESYIQKVFSKKIKLSLKTIERIADRYEVPASSLFQENMQKTEKIREIVDYLVTFDDSKLSAILSVSKEMAPPK